MKPKILWNLLKRHILWFIILPIITATTVFFLTRNAPSVYKSQATLYTGLASGYSLLSDEQQYRIDHVAVNNAFDNLMTTLNSKETMREVGLSLLAKHLTLQKPNSAVLGNPSFLQLQKAIPANLRQSLLSNSNPTAIYQKLDSASRTDTDNPIRKLLLSSNSHYSIGVIGSHLKATRKNTSDMMDMVYESNDPAVAQQTLDLCIKILQERYRYFKQSETVPVIGYYEKQSRAAKQQMDQAEAKLRSFSVQHNVVNFEEEAKNVTDSRETITESYNQELMRNKAAKAAMDALKQRMAQYGSLLSINAELTTRQSALNEAERQLANAQAYGQSKVVLARLQTQVEKASEELKASAYKYYAAGNSTESISQQKLLDEWLTRVLEFEETSARLEIYKKRLEEYRLKTVEYSPMESQLRELKRELNVAEKEYLSSIQSLNQAQRHRQDVSIDGNLSVLDSPNIPLEPESSRQKLLISVGVGVGLFIAILLSALRFWLDNRVSSPEQAELMIGKPVAAVFPMVKKFSINSKASRSAMSMFEQLCSAINIEIVQASLVKAHPPIITLFSIRSKQGKSWVANGLARTYAESGQQVAYYFPQLPDEQSTILEQNGITYMSYALQSNFMNVQDLDLLFDPTSGHRTDQFDKIILELPPLISSPIPIYLLNKSYVSLLVIDANNVWSRTEKQLLGMYSKIATHTTLTVLNKVGGDYIDAPSHLDAKQSSIFYKQLLDSKESIS